ncbi:phytoene desaturase family protein [Thermodesulfobacteriota bacterium]
MAEKSVIVIGAGIAGLSTGCYARMNGYRTTIFEHHNRPGGVVASWRRKGYTIDGGVHFWMGCKEGSAIYRLLEELGVADSCRFMNQDLYMVFVDEALGNRLEVTADLEKLADDMKAVSPKDADPIHELIDGAQGMQGMDLFGPTMDTPAELAGLLQKLKNMWQLRSLIPYNSPKYAEPMREYTQDLKSPWLRFVFENLFLPDVPVWFVMMTLGMLADEDLRLLDGPSTDVTDAMAGRFVDLGGEISYNSTVEQILVENGQAAAVRLADGSEHLADVVVSAADGPGTIFGMLGGLYLDETIEARYSGWKPIDPAVMVSFGVCREFRDDPWLQMIKLGEPFTVGNHTVDHLTLRIFNYTGTLAPQGKAVVQVMFDSDWDWWQGLRQDITKYKSEKQRVAEQVLVCLERSWAGITDQVDVTDVATPYTTWRYTLNSRGAYMGWLPEPHVLTSRMDKQLQGLEGFYMAGQWAMPGGGVPSALYSGRHVVQLLCHEDRKAFETSRFEE